MFCDTGELAVIVDVDPAVEVKSAETANAIIRFLVVPQDQSESFPPPCEFAALVRIKAAAGGLDLAALDEPLVLSGLNDWGWGTAGKKAEAVLRHRYQRNWRGDPYPGD